MCYGFVYIWFDTKRKMFYIGSHHGGSETDGYVGSNVWLQKAFNARPESFRRKIIERNFIVDDKAVTRAMEQKWLHMIKPEELQVRYFNVKRVAAGGNCIEGFTDEQLAKYSQTLSDAAKRRGSHYKQRPLMWQGVRYESLKALKEVIGFDPASRLRSKKSKFADCYYIDVGPPSETEMKAADDAEKIAKIRANTARSDANRSLSDDRKKLRREAATRAIQSWTPEQKKARASKISEKLLDRPTNPIYIDDVYYPNYNAATRALGIPKYFVKLRVNSEDYSNYRRA